MLSSFLKNSFMFELIFFSSGFLFKWLVKYALRGEGSGNFSLVCLVEELEGSGRRLRRVERGKWIKVGMYRKSKDFCTRAHVYERAIYLKGSSVYLTRNTQL